MKTITNSLITAIRDSTKHSDYVEVAEKFEVHSNTVINLIKRGKRTMCYTDKHDKIINELVLIARENNKHAADKVARIKEVLK